MRYIVVGLVLGIALVSGCAPGTHRPTDDWDDEPVMQPEITGNNEKDEARWRRELASDPWAHEGSLLDEDSPETVADVDDELGSDAPSDFVGPPEPPTTWDNMQKNGTKFSKFMFSVLTVLATLGMMAAPYLMMM